MNKWLATLCALVSLTLVHGAHSVVVIQDTGAAGFSCAGSVIASEDWEGTDAGWSPAESDPDVTYNYTGAPQPAGSTEVMRGTATAANDTVRRFNWWTADTTICLEIDLYVVDQDLGGQQIIEVWDGATTLNGLRADGAGNWHVRCDGVDGATFATPYSQWVTVALNLDRTAGDCDAYVDGILESSATGGGTGSGYIGMGYRIVTSDVRGGDITVYDRGD